jgi:hypothetical protein
LEAREATAKAKKTKREEERVQELKKVRGDWREVASFYC